MDSLDRIDHDNDDSFILILSALIIFMLVLLILITSSMCVPTVPGVQKTQPATKPATQPTAPPTAQPTTGSFAEGVAKPSDNCAAFGGTPDLVNPGEMYDQHPLIEFCITSCPLYDDAVVRATAEDAAIENLRKTDPTNSLWEIRQEYYTIYLDALHTQGEKLGC